MTSPAPWPLLGVVIPVFNDWLGLQRCLQALALQTYPRQRLLVRVVDNGSSDWPDQPTFPLPVEVIRHRKPGSYGARNQAALGWPVDVLAFTDADCCPEPAWAAAGVEAVQIASAQPRLVAGRIRLEVLRPEAPTAGEQLDQILGFDQARTVRRAGFGVTANLFVARVCFEQLQGFHRKTRSGGDRDFCLRARSVGYPLIYCPGAVVRHPTRCWDELVLKQRRILGGRLSLAANSASARWWVLALSLRPVVSEWVRVCRYPGLPWRRRLQLLGLVWQLRAAVLQEWLRLQHPDQDPLR